MSRSADSGTCVKLWSLIPIGLIWIVLLGWSLLRVPVPAVNEPHYLAKARHWWNPDWCPGDFFLDSSNPHLVFYSTFGWLAESCSLPMAAMLGRGLGLLILAGGWQSLTQAVTGRLWGGLLALPLLLTLQTLGNLSGEWLVGGIEAKVPAYGCLFWAMGSFLTGRFPSAGLAAGLATSLHPLVGLWGVVAGGLASLPVYWWKQYRYGGHSNSSASHSSQIAPAQLLADRRSFCWMLALFVLTAFPGLIPAVGVLQSQDPAAERIANQLQIGDRLAHHLDPMRFSKESYRYWGLLIVVWLLLETKLPSTPSRTWWRACIASAILIALVGVLIGWGPRPVTLMPGHEWRLRLLKFYFFRLGDQFVPIALSLAAVNTCLNLIESSGQRRSVAGISCLAGLLATVLGAIFIPFADETPSRLNAAELSDWRAACDWIRDHSRKDELVYNTDSGWAIKWFAQRPEYVSYKDMPQDAASIVEWNRRLWVLANWRMAATADGQVTSEELADLRKQTGIHYMISRRFGPIVPEPAYTNSRFRIHVLPDG